MYFLTEAIACQESTSSRHTKFLEAKQKLWTVTQMKLEKSHFLTLGHALDYSVSHILAGQFEKTKTVLKRTIKLATKCNGGSIC